MKKIYLTILVACVALLVTGQSVLHYDFTNSLSEVKGNGPVLTVLGSEGIFIEDTLGEVEDIKKWVYRFEKNSGFQFDNAASGNFLGENYTIELYFVFDALNSWKRVVDWKNRKTDYGAYVYNGELNFYPYVYSSNAPVVAGEYTYYVITRDAETKELLIYTDAKAEIAIIDNSGDGLLDSDNVLNIFHDDLVVANEASSGAVALLKLYNYKLDSNAIKNNYDNLAGNIFGINEHALNTTNISAYPNPANDELNIDLNGFNENEKVRLSLINNLGAEVSSIEIMTINQKIIKFNTSGCKHGIYLIIAESNSHRATAKVLIQ